MKVIQLNISLRRWSLHKEPPLVATVKTLFLYYLSWQKRLFDLQKKKKRFRAVFWEREMEMYYVFPFQSFRSRIIWQTQRTAATSWFNPKSLWSRSWRRCRSIWRMKRRWVPPWRPRNVSWRMKWCHWRETWTTWRWPWLKWRKTDMDWRTRCVNRQLCVTAGFLHTLIELHLFYLPFRWRTFPRRCVFWMNP